MRGGARPLVCELHAHTAWSDGDLSLGVVVDLYGMAGFDVHCVTDHVLRSDDPWPLSGTGARASTPRTWARTSRSASAPAPSRPTGSCSCRGLELTYNDPNPDRAAHAVGLHSLVAMDDGPAAAMETARVAGAAILVAHPHDFGPTPTVPFPTVLLRAVPAGAARALRSRGALQRAAAFQVGRGGRPAGRRLR